MYTHIYITQINEYVYIYTHMYITQTCLYIYIYILYARNPLQILIRTKDAAVVLIATFATSATKVLLENHADHTLYSFLGMDN